MGRTSRRRAIPLAWARISPDTVLLPPAEEANWRRNPPGKESFPANLHDSLRSETKPLGAYLLGIARRGMTRREAEEHLDELKQLSASYGIPAVGSEMATVDQPNPAYFIGSGKAERVCEAARALNAEVIVVDDDLTPAQQRNWEKLAGRAVIDRQEVILGIFADRAQTREARLQIELARLEYSLPRLRRQWTHLERQRGGGAFKGGAGEAQLETDRRLVENQILKLKRDLAHVRQVRATQRKDRLRNETPSVALVGYTNAGKSSLMNRLTGADVLVQNKLFATLDPTTRKLVLPSKRTVAITDTVGFIRKLPHELVESFKATLEEAQLAGILLHVVDASHPNVKEHIAAAEAVLEELEVLGKPTVLVLNKVDLLEERSILAELRYNRPHVVPVSTATGEGIDALLEKIEELTAPDAVLMHLRIPAERSELLSLVHREGTVRNEKYEDATAVLEAFVPRRWQSRLSPFLAQAG